MTEPTYFIVDGPILVPSDDSADADTLPDLVAPTSGRVIFSYALAPGEMFRLASSPAAALIARKETAVIQSDGNLLRLKDDGTVGGALYLLANDEALGIEGDLPINVKFEDVFIPGSLRKIRLNAFQFIAPTAAVTKHFAELIPVPGTVASGVTQGLTGVGLTGEGHVNLDGTVQFELTDGTETDPLALNLLSIGGIDGGTPSDPGIGTLEGGTP